MPGCTEPPLPNGGGQRARPGPHSRLSGFFTCAACFECVATSQTCEHTKPFADPVLWAAAQMGVDPRAVLMVGDTTVDIHAGRSAGAQTVGVLCGFGREAELRRAGANQIIPTTADLPALLHAY